MKMSPDSRKSESRGNLDHQVSFYLYIYICYVNLVTYPWGRTRDQKACRGVAYLGTVEAVHHEVDSLAWDADDDALFIIVNNAIINLL